MPHSDGGHGGPRLAKAHGLPWAHPQNRSVRTNGGRSANAARTLCLRDRELPRSQTPLEAMRWRNVNGQGLAFPQAAWPTRGVGDEPPQTRPMYVFTLLCLLRAMASVLPDVRGL